MKNASKIAIVVEKIIEIAPQMGGVFSTADLSSLIIGENDLNNQRMISRLVASGILTRVLKGIYVTKDADLHILSHRIDEHSYVSMDSALADAGLTGSVPQRSLSVIHTGRKNEIVLSNGRVYFYSIKPELYFGFSATTSGVNIANPEKAYIDLLYFYMKGTRYLIDPLQDVNVGKLDINNINLYLKKYKNPKFISFVKGSI
jgi:predicted transcriptional regulator of viral defense system